MKSDAYLSETAASHGGSPASVQDGRRILTGIGIVLGWVESGVWGLRPGARCVEGKGLLAAPASYVEGDMSR